jgi:hypothetical protein
MENFLSWMRWWLKFKAECHWDEEKKLSLISIHHGFHQQASKQTKQNTDNGRQHQKIIHVYPTTTPPTNPLLKML